MKNEHGMGYFKCTKSNYLIVYYFATYLAEPAHIWVVHSFPSGTFLLRFISVY